MNLKNLQNKLSEITEFTGLAEYYLEKAKSLPKKERVFIISDMDDTLLARSPLTQAEELLRTHRGMEGNKVVINHFGISDIVSRFYSDTNPPKDIQDMLRDPSYDSLILTAWVPEFAYEKALAGWLLDIPFCVVDSAQDKILKTLQYVVQTLRYIPSEIRIYEDRPNFFIEYKELIEELLGTKLSVFYVEMNENESYKTIKQTHKKI